MLRDRVKAKHGFTLMELLVSIAIVIVLAAIAIPSVASLTQNMLLRELNLAAAELGQAAQNQMTSLKVSGVWLKTLEEIGESAAHGLPDDVDQDDICYMTAEQAKNANIIKVLAIDSSVYKGDFIIEFSRSTATVFSVFYADGRSSILASAPSTTTGAGAYYSSISNADARNEDRRSNASPMVGYYQGTPAGATNTVALQRPAIWVGETDGVVCIQNPNLTNTTSGAVWATGSILKVTITKDSGDQGVFAFSLNNLIKPLADYSIEATGLDAFTRTSETELSLIARDGSANFDTFTLDLTQIFTILAAQSDEYKALADNFAPSDKVWIDAEITTPPGSPIAEMTKATALLELSGSDVKFTVLVTNPDYREDGVSRAAHINSDPNAYLDPVVSVVTTGGSSTKPITTAEPQTFTLAETATQLSAENPQAAYQAYTGGYVTDRQIDPTMYIQAQVGAYAATGASGHRNYAITEIWIKGEGYTRIGTLANRSQNGGAVDNWLWSYPAFADYISGWLTTSNRATSIPEANAVRIKAEGFAELCAEATITADEEGSYSVYVRTAPAIHNVEEFYFNSPVTSINAPPAGTTTSVRKTDSAAVALREQFEQRFGAASSVALLTISREAGGEDGEGSGVKGFPTNINDCRIYYSYTPALGFAESYDQNTLKQAVYRPQNTVLWYRYVGGDDKLEQPAMVQRNREGELASDIYLTLDANGAFALPHKQDPLFYRAIFYHDNDSTFLTPSSTGEINPQFIPYTRQADSTYTTTVVLKFGSRSVWYTEDVYNPPNSTDHIKTTTLVYSKRMSIYDDTVARGRVDMYPASPGMMYIELDGTKPTAYYGYKDGFATTISSTLEDGQLPDNNKKTNWGYYTIVPIGADAPTATLSAKASATTNPLVVPADTSPITIKIDGTSYYAYRLNSNFDGGKVLTENAPATNATITNNRLNRLTSDQRMTCVFNGITVTYYCNILFAAAVTKTAADTNAWGTATAPYQVRHADQLWGYLPRVSNSDGTHRLEAEYDDKKYIQTHSFDMRGYQNVGSPEHYPLYTEWSMPGFVYDGGNYTISGYTLTNTVYNTSVTYVGSYAGLFARVRAGTVKNVRMIDGEKAAITTGTGVSVDPHACVGILIGQLHETNCVVENCSVSGFDISVTLGGNIDDEAYVGGLIGYAHEDTKISGCTVSDVTLNVETDKTNIYNRLAIGVGGVIGAAYDRVNIADCSASNVDVSLLANKKPTANVCTNLEVGGFAGLVEYDVNIDTCSVAKGTVSASVREDVTNQRIGGFVGYVKGVTANRTNITNCTVSQTPVSLDSDESTVTHVDAGGFIGKVYLFVNIEECTATDGSLDVTLKNATITEHRIGGFIGILENYVKLTNSELINSPVTINIQNVTTTLSNIGGFLGEIWYYSDVTGCATEDGNISTAFDSLSAIATFNFGGFVGQTETVVTVTTCSEDDTKVSAQMSGKVQSARIGGFIAYTYATATVKDCTATLTSITATLGSDNNNLVDIGIGGFIGRTYSTATIENCNAVDGEINYDFDGSGTTKPRQRFGGFLGNSQLVTRVKNSHVIGGSITVDVTDGTATTNNLDVGGFLGRTYEATNSLTSCSVNSSESTGKRFAIEILGASYSGVASGNKVFSMRVGGLVGSSYYCTLTSNIVNGVSIHVTAPDGRAYLGTTTYNFAGFGGVAGYLYNVGYTHNGNQVSNVSFDMDWIGSREIWAGNGYIVAIGQGYGYAYSNNQGTISNGSYSNSSIVERLIRSNGEVVNYNVSSIPGIDANGYAIAE